MAATFTVAVEGLDKILPKLDGNRLHRPAVKASTLRMAHAIEGVVKNAAPKQTGHMAGSVHATSLGTLSAIVRVTARAYKPSRRKPNYRYPRRLNYDQRLRTFGWLDKTKGPAAAAAQRELNSLARDVERVWRA